MRQETVEKGLCPGCGLEVDFRVIPAPREESVRVHMRGPHKAPCGLPCHEGRDVVMQQVYQKEAHHPRHCDCLKEGKGYS
jgi:hypothetical protein